MHPKISTRTRTLTTLAGLAAIAAPAALALAQSDLPGEPVYVVRFADCVTADNQFRALDGTLRWDVDAGCDIYQQDVYERPTGQLFELVGGRYGAFEYDENLDISEARAGFDDRWLYVAIDLFGRDEIDSTGDRDREGLVERYGFRMSTDPDGRFGVLLTTNQPELRINPTTGWGVLAASGFRDTNGDVGGAATSGPTGLFVTRSDNPAEGRGLNGFDQTIIRDGVLLSSGERVLFFRLSPTDNTVVEMALDYQALGFTQDDLRTLAYFDIEAVESDGEDPRDYLWNDDYTREQAGSPNPGVGGLSEFGTRGLGEIYEADTVRGGPIVACRADVNGDGVLDLFDFLAFQNAFSAGERTADFNDDGVLDFFDFLAFQNAFSIGC